MPISYTIDHENKRLYSRATGIVTFDELLSHMRAESGTAAASYAEIFDCTDATTNVSTSDIRLLVDHRRKIAEDQQAAPVAIVATTDLFFGMFRIFDMLSEEIRPIKVLRSRNAAVEWLNNLENPADTKADSSKSSR